jgi:hypothetical protein
LAHDWHTHRYRELDDSRVGVLGVQHEHSVSDEKQPNFSPGDCEALMEKAVGAVLQQIDRLVHLAKKPPGRFEYA